MNKRIVAGLGLLMITTAAFAQQKVFPGADEKTPSKAQYFSWINNTNEGASIFNR